MRHKTHGNSDEILGFFMKPTVITPKNSKRSPPAGAGLVAVQAPSVEKHLSPAPTQLRTHARTHDTNTKRNRNRFPDWAQLTLLSPQSPIHV